MTNQIYNIKGDIGYSNAYWFKWSDQCVIGMGELEGMIGPIEVIETWAFERFSEEAAQLNCKVFDFHLDNKIKYLNNLKDNINSQISQLTASMTLRKEQLQPTNERPINKNTENKKSNKPKSRRTEKHHQS